MYTRTTVTGTLLGTVLVLAVSAPAAAQAGGGNLLAAAGVTFAPAAADSAPAAMATDTAVPALRLDAPLAFSIGSAPRAASTPHRIGGGLRTGGYAYGIGGLLRYWFSDALLVDLSAAHYGYYSYLSYNVVSASVLYSFKTIEPSGDIVTVRIYAGGGVTISHWSYDALRYAGVNATSIGGQGLAGAEAIFKQVPKLGVGVDVGFYTTHNDFGLHGYGGLGSAIYAVWYFK